VAAGLGFANIWPMLFSITVEERPERANELSGLMCMAISGGAVVPLLMGLLLDLTWGAAAFVVPTVCFAYLFLLSLRGGARRLPRRRRRTSFSRRILMYDTTDKRIVMTLDAGAPAFASAPCAAARR